MVLAETVPSVSRLQAKSRKYQGIQALQTDPQMDGQMPVQYHNLTDFHRRIIFFFNCKSKTFFAYRRMDRLIIQILYAPRLKARA